MGQCLAGITLPYLVLLFQDPLVPVDFLLKKLCWTVKTLKNVDFVHYSCDFTVFGVILWRKCMKIPSQKKIFLSTKLWIMSYHFSKTCWHETQNLPDFVLPKPIYDKIRVNYPQGQDLFGGGAQVGTAPHPQTLLAFFQKCPPT